MNARGGGARVSDFFTVERIHAARLREREFSAIEFVATRE
jgi:hypothetical protein